MKVLIVGASSFVGRHISSRAVELGHEVLGTQFTARKPGLVEFDLRDQRIANCVDREFLKSDEPTYCVVAAAISQIDRCYREREVSSQVNVTNTIRLIQDLDSFGIRTVFISTGSIFDGVEGNYNEGSLPSPVNEYGRHKLRVEEFIRADVPSGLIVRLDKVIGDDPSENHLFSEWTANIRDGKPIVCIEGQDFCPTLVDDIAKAVVMSCESGLEGVYNVVNPEHFSRDGLARKFVEAMGADVEVTTKPESEFGFLDRRPPRSFLDPAKFIGATGFQFTSVEDCFHSFQNKLHMSG